MHSETFGGVRIFRPSYGAENAIRRSAKSHLLSRFKPGTYRGGPSANEVIQHRFSFYENCLRKVIPRIASRDAAEFLLFQYDQSMLLMHGKGIHDAGERERWSHIEPGFKRALKYLTELMCIECPGAQPSTTKEKAFRDMEVAMICAECMVELAEMSNLAYTIFPEHALVTVFDDYGNEDVRIEIEGEYAGYDRHFASRLIRDRQSRERFVGKPQFDVHTDTHAKFLDGAFQTSFGMTYAELIACIVSVVDSCVPAPKGFPTLFVNRSKVLAKLGESGRSKAAIAQALDGFSASPDALLLDKRVVWNPKQEHGLFVVDFLYSRTKVVHTWRSRKAWLVRISSSSSTVSAISAFL